MELDRLSTAIRRQSFFRTDILSLHTFTRLQLDSRIHGTSLDDPGPDAGWRCTNNALGGGGRSRIRGPLRP